MDRVLEFAGNHTLLAFALVTSLLLVIFSELRRKATGVLSVEPQEAVQLINGDALVIDLRSAGGFGRGHIVNARNIPADELDARIGKLGSDKAKPVLVACEAGLLSTKAVQKLREAGFSSAYGLKGGMNAWADAGLPVVSGKKTRNRK